MPKKKRIEPPEKQSARFIEDAQKMIDAGELSPIEADEALDELVRKGARPAKAE